MTRHETHTNLLDAFTRHKRDAALDAHRARWAEIDAAWLAGETAPLLAASASARVNPTYANPIMHRGWRIYHEAPPIPSRNVWRFISDDYDAETIDGVWTDNGLCGDGPSIQDCIDQINEIIAEQEYETARGQRESDLAGDD